MLTTSEKRWIKDFKAIARRKPENLLLYIMDGDRVYICKRGVPSDDIMEMVSLYTMPCCVVKDMHDDMNNGDY